MGGLRIHTIMSSLDSASIAIYYIATDMHVSILYFIRIITKYS